jgi:hypothetical protein
MSERITPKTRQMVINQTESRHTWKEYDTTERIEAMIHAEFQELQEALELASIGGGLFEVASELGDILYLAIKLEHDRGRFGRRTTSMIAEALTIADMIGLDINQCVETKAIRNGSKYPHHFSDNGYSYYEGIELSKKMWELMGGDFAFSHAYLELVK